MRDDFVLKLALGSGLGAASAAVLFVASPASIPLFIVATVALAVSAVELVRQADAQLRLLRSRPGAGRRG